MKLSFILGMVLFSSLPSLSCWAKQIGCIAYHPKDSVGLSSPSHDVACPNETFSVSAPIDYLWTFGDAEERMVVKDLKEEMKRRKNYTAVASMKPMKEKPLFDVSTVHVFVKVNPNEKRVFCTLIKFEEKTIGALGGVHKAKNMVAKCPATPSQNLILVTEEVGHQFMQQHGLEKDFEVEYTEQFDPGENNTDPQSSTSIAVYSKKI